jgi:DnaJ like chaperone protein
MKQIFDRISQILRAEKNSKNYDFADLLNRNEDDELKKIIDELNSEKHQTKQNDFNQKDTKKTISNLDEAYKVLGIDNNSTIEQIKEAYKTKMKEYHPDKVSGLGEELQNLARIKTQQINEAYSLIRKIKNF